MTLRRLLVMAVAMLLVCSTVTAISLFKEEPPAGLPAGANVTIGESVVVQPAVSAHLTKLAVERIHPANATPASLITITLKVTNRGNERAKARLTEDQRPGVQYPDKLTTHYHGYEAMKVPYYSWDLTLEPGSTQSITYHMKPESVGLIAFTSALLTDEYGNQIESAMTGIRVSCIPNGVCDAGENTIFCPEDCPIGGSDGICDGIPDGKVDPDCVQGYDPDAGTKPAAASTKKGLLPGPSAAMTIAVVAFTFFFARYTRYR